jgi:DNA-binding response OmpR family regulator
MEMAEKILVADDEEGMVSFIRDALIREGYEVLAAYDGRQALELARRQPDLILLDVMMPGMDGYEVCHAVREIVSCPVLFLSALQSEADRIKGLAVGGDDYIVKPFSIRELKMRVHAHLRREKRAVPTDKRAFLRFGSLSVDLKGREVHFGTRPLVFTKREFDIVELLSMHAGIVFSKDQIYEKIWGWDAEGDPAGVAEHVKNIRFKLNEADPGGNYITTVWGVGYKWERAR